ncbi:hypothetical protein I302_108711 [Kwoniella bestiolae CBS 10118]|uniref:SET domain-containing protein n=1 Tax=Kwoniella bestiolae CBS 10118 TaxID=1296100 RepID=A0A1B9FTW1_9TREE|nr:hypothetical protein I302_07848 [Kwoniella bestiolae CBS 10118]OCF22203.1 hypothetical protein I302_07848 [Kwoniella bestiolae CBS 10118]
MWRKHVSIVAIDPQARPPQPVYQFQSNDSSCSVPFHPKPISSRRIKDLCPNVGKKALGTSQVSGPSRSSDLPPKPSNLSFRTKDVLVNPASIDTTAKKRPPLLDRTSFANVHDRNRHKYSSSSNPQLLTPLSATSALPPLPSTRPTPNAVLASSRDVTARRLTPHRVPHNTPSRHGLDTDKPDVVPRTRPAGPLPTPSRSESPYPVPPASPKLLCKLSTFDDKNLGLSSTQTIKKGTLIMRESPFALIPVNHKDEDITTEHVHPVYTEMSTSQKDLFRSLHQRTDEDADPDPLVNIVETNAIPLQPEHTSQVRSLGLFEIISRINHSCCPNAGWAWYQDEQMLHLYAYTNIPAGCEITVSYIDDVTYPTNQRQKQLLWGYGFECLCSACTRSPSEMMRSDQNLKVYQSLRDKWMSTPAEQYAKSLPRALKALDLALDILKQERKYDEFGEVYDQLLAVYACHGKRVEAEEVAGRLLDHYTRIWGVDKALRETRYAMYARDPSLCEGWECLVDPDEERKVKKRRVS